MYGVWWEEPSIRKIQKLRNVDFWESPILYLKIFLGEEIKNLQKLELTDLVIIYNIINICTAGYRKNKDVEEKSEAENIIQQRIAKRKQKMIERGEIVEEKKPDVDSDLLWIMTILMKGDLSQPYESILDMNLTEIFGIFDKLKVMEDKRKERKAKEKRGLKKPDSTSKDVSSLNLPTFGERRDDK